MKRLVALLPVLALLGGISAPAQADDPYRTALSCDRDASSEKECFAVDIFAYFESEKGRTTHYTLCLRRYKSITGPLGKKKCKKHTTNADGIDFVDVRPFQYSGPIQASWKVNGRLVGKDRIYAY